MPSLLMSHKKRVARLVKPNPNFKELKVSAKWRKLLCHIPGYDPFRDAAGCWFDADEAQRVLDFFPECLKHVEGAAAGQPFVLELWQQSILANLFGWKMLDEYGRECRRYRQVLLKVGRKNGKTPLVAGLCVYVLFCDNEPGAQIYSAAYDTEQAGLLFRHASGMVEQEPELASRAKILRGYGQRTITFEAQGSAYHVLSAEAKSKHGANPHLVIIDELEMQPNGDLVAAFRTAMVSANRRQPMMIFVGTEDYERESIANETYDYAAKVRDGVINNPRYLPVIYEVPKDKAFETYETPEGQKEGWQLPELWKLANPNMGVSVSEQGLRELCQEACDSPVKLNDFLRFNLNIKTGQVTRWLMMDKWAACAAGVADALEWRKAALERHKGETCHVGLDLGSTSDLTALALLFPTGGTKYDLIPFFWVPAEGVRQKDHAHKALYDSWIHQGFIEETSGNVTDYDVVRQRVMQLAGVYPFARDPESGKPEIAVDRLFQGAQVCTQLQNEGLEVIAFGQGFYSMAAPTKEFEERVLAGDLNHGNNPVLKWMASNVCVRTDPAGCMKPEKPKKTSPLKIDGIVAAIMALGRAMGQRKAESVYETRGLRRIVLNGR